eukprot:CAMPEP_0178406726 /NCGR_PEP_ID=MMETSP0689_2-20121128/19060_1 /TAXON_ID=160604 /ORGANISM="Amphidinium massartii, Strain CS-259" /LENGTH=489 /DNA_ID=CAMNT_0020027775 /DNA_START=265 /DNA_END=1734 /DNA_ORIENTATION=+
MWWGSFLEVTFVASFAGGLSTGKAFAAFLAAGRRQLVILYFAAVFWKLTSSFLSYRHSCATVLIAELVGAIVPADLVPVGGVLTGLLLQLSPALVILVEFAVPMGLWLSPRIGIVIALLFHATIAMMPFTYAGGFSVGMCSRVLLCAPGVIAHGLAASLEVPTLPRLLPRLIVPVAVAAFLAIARMTRGLLDCTACWIGVLAFCYLQGLLSLWSKGETVLVPSLHRGDVSKARASLLTVICCICFIYAFVTPVLGIQAMGAPTMFACLNQFMGGGGLGNHILVPTGVLAKVLGAGGGLDNMVRVEEVHAAVNGSALRLMLPSSDMADLPPHANNMLAAANVSGYYGIYITRMGSHGPLQDVDPEAPAERVTFGSYVSVAMPAFELRRGLAAARERKERFRLVYTKLPQRLQTPGEFVRYDPLESKDPFARVEVEEDPYHGVALCKSGGADCAPDEYAVQTSPIPWLSRLLLPYPVPLHMDDDEEIFCAS